MRAIIIVYEYEKYDTLNLYRILVNNFSKK